VSRATGSLTDSILSRAKNNRHGLAAWYDLAPPDVLSELTALRTRWQAGTTGLTKRAVARAILAEMQARKLRVSGIQGVENWLEKID
jgi:hypothetical protein